MTGATDPGATEARLAAIVNSSHDAIIGRSIDGTVTSWNPGAERLYGYTAAEIVGRRIDLLLPPELREDERAIELRLAAGERIEQYHARRLRKDGRAVTVSVTMSPIADESGVVVGLASVSREIGDRERAVARFRGLLESAPDAVICVDATGNIALVNAEAERLFGYTRDELISRRVELLVPERWRDVHPGHRTVYFDEPRPRPMGAGQELAGRRKDGTEFPAEISLSAIRTDEEILVIATVRDVTERIEERAERERLKSAAERERLERELQQSQRLESLGLLAGGVAHDFNNLLAVILNYSSFLGEELGAAAADHWDERLERAGTDLEEIRLAAERATGLTRQLLAFGRREVVRPEVLSVNDVVRDVEQLLRRTIGEDVELRTSLDPGLRTVLADRGQLEQVLLNLAVNARDAMPAGGTLAIETCNTTAHDGSALVCLQVSDTGMGMAPDVLARAFEPFFTTKPKGEGSGLGLATVYGIVTQGGGHVDIASTLGSGTTVSALLPASADVAVARVGPEDVRPRRGTETVLVVEDEDAMREVTRRILVRNGYDVLTASVGAEAVAIVEADAAAVDLVVTDVVMPRMNGKELVRRLRELRPELRVLYISGYAAPVLASKGTPDTGVELLEKPFTEAVLLAKVREILDAP